MNLFAMVQARRVPICAYINQPSHALPSLRGIITELFLFSACMLYTYATLMALILLVEIGLAVTVYVFKGDARKFVSEGMRKGMINYPVSEADEHQGVKETW